MLQEMLDWKYWHTQADNKHLSIHHTSCTLRSRFLALFDLPCKLRQTLVNIKHLIRLCFTINGCTLFLGCSLRLMLIELQYMQFLRDTFSQDTDTINDYE